MNNENICSCCGDSCETARNICLDCLDAIGGKEAFKSTITSIVIESPKTLGGNYKWWARKGKEVRTGLCHNYHAARCEADAALVELRGGAK
jgi:hypothetical protein